MFSKLKLFIFKKKMRILCKMISQICCSCAPRHNDKIRVTCHLKSFKTGKQDWKKSKWESWGGCNKAIYLLWKWELQVRVHTEAVWISQRKRRHKLRHRSWRQKCPPIALPTNLEIFLVVDTQLYKRLCVSVRSSVRPSIRPSVSP